MVQRRCFARHAEIVIVYDARGSSQTGSSYGWLGLRLVFAFET